MPLFLVCAVQLYAFDYSEQIWRFVDMVMAMWVFIQIRIVTEFWILAHENLVVPVFAEILFFHVQILI